MVMACFHEQLGESFLHQRGSKRLSLPCIRAAGWRSISWHAFASMDANRPRLSVLLCPRVNRHLRTFLVNVQIQTASYVEPLWPSPCAIPATLGARPFPLSSCWRIEPLKTKLLGWDGIDRLPNR